MAIASLWVRSKSSQAKPFSAVCVLKVGGKELSRVVVVVVVRVDIDRNRWF